MSELKTVESIYFYSIPHFYFISIYFLHLEIKIRIDIILSITITNYYTTWYYVTYLSHITQKNIKDSGKIISYNIFTYI